MDFAQLIPQFIIWYAILLFCLSFHEAAHAIVAKWGGDMTSAYQGRITLNPIAHIDPVGTVLMPILMFFLSAAGPLGNIVPFLAWAKPVPVNDLQFRRASYGAVVALAGPFSNLVLAFIGAIAYQLVLLSGHAAPGGGTGAVTFSAGTLLIQFIITNCSLAVFNLLPIPPLDGSHVLWHAFVKHRPALIPTFHTVAQFSFIIIIVLINLPFMRAAFGTAVFLLVLASQYFTSLGP